MTTKSSITYIQKSTWFLHPAPCQYLVQQCRMYNRQFSTKTYKPLLMVVMEVFIQWEGGPLWCGGALIVGCGACQKLESAATDSCCHENGGKWLKNGPKRCATYQSKAERLLFLVVPFIHTKAGYNVLKSKKYTRIYRHFVQWQLHWHGRVCFFVFACTCRCRPTYV